MFKHRHYAVVLAFSALLAFSACSSVPGGKSEYTGDNDPFESVNRVIFDVNDFLDRLLLRPLAELYRVTVPPPLRDRVAGIVKNMSEPVIFANNVLQGEVTRAGTTLGRFLTNTTLGVGGMFEVANGFGLPRQTGDFGQTLYTWGLPSGPYLVLPLFGPSTVREGIGLGVDSFMSPWKYVVAIGDDTTYTAFMASDTTANALVKREENIEPLDTLREGSLDFYAQMRSVYRQHRAKELGAPLPSDMPTFEDFEAEQVTPIIH